MEELFIDEDGTSYGCEQIMQALLEIGANDCETLFIHSDVMFGKPGHDFKRKNYLNQIDDIIQSMHVHNLIVPTFTYSFCNHVDYDVRSSRTLMGAYNEYVRKKTDRYRTMDPLLSLSVPGNLAEYFKKYEGEHSLGGGGGLDAVHHMDGVKFLFLGADMGECFTYVHYVEKMLEVPYRYDQIFEGHVIDMDGNTIIRRQYMHTQCFGVKLPAKYDYFEDEMVEKGFVRKKRVGDKFIACINEKDAYEQIKSKINEDINYFLKKPFTDEDLIHKYTYNYEIEPVMHC